MSNLLSNGEILGIRIQNLTSTAQLTHAGIYHFDSMSSNVNSNVSEEDRITNYSVGDFHAILMASSANINENGCRYGTLVVFTPRLLDDFGIGTIWDFKLALWTMLGK